jgi:hypothetical protein
MAKREIPAVLEVIIINVWNSVKKTFEPKEYPSTQAVKLLDIGKVYGFFKPYLENEITDGADRVSGAVETEIVTNSLSN